MSDVADTAADYQERLNATALANRAAGAYQGPGQEHCARCGEPVGEYRWKRLHAKYCMPCQTDLQYSGRGIG